MHTPLLAGNWYTAVNCSVVVKISLGMHNYVCVYARVYSVICGLHVHLSPMWFCRKSLGSHLFNWLCQSQVTKFVLNHNTHTQKLQSSEKRLTEIVNVCRVIPSVCRHDLTTETIKSWCRSNSDGAVSIYRNGPVFCVCASVRDFSCTDFGASHSQLMPRKTKSA